MKVYLAGPMRGYPNYNFVAHFTAAALLRMKGFEVMSPAEMDMACGATKLRHSVPYNERVEWDGDMDGSRERDRQAIDKCDIFVMLPGSAMSEGVQDELEYVDTNCPGVKIHKYRNDTPDGIPWLEFQRYSKCT